MLAEAIVGSLIGDYLLQNDWMAKNKKTNSLICSLHCALWALCVCLLGELGIYSFIFLLVTHFIIDRTSFVVCFMEVIGQKDFKTNLKPWSIIIVDNVFHFCTIYNSIILFESKL